MIAITRLGPPSHGIRPVPVLTVDPWLDGHPRASYPEVVPDDGRARYRPYPAWPRCTRWIAYRQTRSASGEAVVGSWRFRADWLAERLQIGAAAAYLQGYEDDVLVPWLRDRDNDDERLTRLPDNWGVISFQLQYYVGNGACRPFCMTCGTNILLEELRLEGQGDGLSDIGLVIRCAHGHALLDNRGLIQVG